MGWINGNTAIIHLLFGCTFGLFLIYKSKKTNAKLLFYLGLSIFFLGLISLGNILDFMTILLTGNNMDNVELYGILGYIWGPIAFLFLLTFGAELLIPEKKWYIISTLLVLCIIFELFLFLDPRGSFDFVVPEKSGEDLLNCVLIPWSLLFILLSIYFLFFIIFLGFGLFYKAYQLTGIVRKKFFLLLLGTSLYLAFTLLDIITSLPFFRIGTLSGYCFWYLGLREEPAKPKKVTPKKEVKIEEGLFRLSKRPAEITEEEVTVSKEKKICLVCKGKALRFIFICPDCETIYCEKCALTLSNLENACWVCETPFDESKPVRLPEKKEEKIASKERKATR